MDASPEPASDWEACSFSGSEPIPDSSFTMAAMPKKADLEFYFISE
jgi:hypothetical protein